MTTNTTPATSIDPADRPLHLFWLSGGPKPAMTMLARFFPCWVIKENGQSIVAGDQGELGVQVKLEKETTYLQLPHVPDDLGKAAACTRCANQLKCLTATDNGNGLDRDTWPNLNV